jgi:hypothetical protein
MCYLTFGVPHLDSCSIIADTKLLLHICSYFKSEHSIQSQKFVSPYFVKKQPIENVSNKIVNLGWMDGRTDSQIDKGNRHADRQTDRQTDTGRKKNRYIEAYARYN